MKIRKTQATDMGIIMTIYAQAKLFMQKNGNEGQWVDGYPSKDLIMKDLTKGNSYVCIDDKDEIIGTFCFAQGDDDTYAKIYNGSWLNNQPYGVVHRIAGTGKAKGIATFCLQWCFAQCHNIRIDTHQNNLIMQNILSQNGYTPCGIIYTENGTERLAFQKYVK
ncbi:MAG: GNAT family N-acetyltransferase [Tannerellaceae bacterium]